MAELHSQVSLRHSQARRASMGSRQFHRQATLFEMQDEIVDGTHVIDDDTQGFFAKGREIESVGDAHT